MADVLMEYKGKQKRVPAEKVDVILRAGGRVVSDAPAAAPVASPAPSAPEGPGLLERATAKLAEGEKNLSDAMARGRATERDMLTTGARGITFGLDDVAAGAGAALGAGMAGGDMGEAYDEGVAERRAKVAAAKKSSPVASTVGEVGGALLTIPLGGASTLGGRVAKAGAMGAVGGAGFGDEDTLEGAAWDAAKGAALAGGLTVGVPAAMAAGRAAKRAAPALAGRGAGLLERATGAVEKANPIARGVAALASGGTSEAAIAAAKLGAKGLRQVAGAVPAAARPSWLAGLVDDLGNVAYNSPSGLELAARAPKAAPAVSPQRAALRFLAPIDDVADDVARPAPVAAPVAAPVPAPAPAAPVAQVADDVADEVVARAAPVPPPPRPATGPAGEVLTDLRRSTLGRLPTQEEIRRAIEEVAIREGTTDIATLSNQIGLPTTKLRDVLVPMLRDFQFRQAVAAGRAGRAGAGASSAADEAAEAGRTVRAAKESARSPIDNVSGRGAGQVAAVRQQEQWRAAYDRLPPEQRANFIDVLRRESGLADDVIRRRLGLTKAEWRRTSFTRSQVRTPEMNRLEALDSLSP